MIKKALLILKVLGTLGVLGSFLIIANDLSLNPMSHISVSQLPLFFTNQSNALAAVFFIVTNSMNSRLLISRATYENMRGGLIIYLFLASSVHWLLLSHLLHLNSLSMYTAIAYLHSGGFLILLLDWLLDRPQIKLPFSLTFKWLAYPIAYLGLMTIYGLFSHWYPYPFINPELLGFPKWGMINGSITMVMGVLSVAFIKLNNCRLEKPSTRIGHITHDSVGGN